jgi:hypothetical protein
MATRAGTGSDTAHGRPPNWSGARYAEAAYFVLQGCLELAVAGHQIKANPAKSPVVSKPRAGDGDRFQPWTDGVSAKELAEYLGHHDPAFTLRIYAHLCCPVPPIAPDA